VFADNGCGSAASSGTIGRDFIGAANPNRFYNSSLGAILGVPAVGPLALRPDLVDTTNPIDKYVIEIKPFSPYGFAGGLIENALYLGLLDIAQPAVWRSGSYKDYLYRDTLGLPIVDGLDYPYNSNIAVVLPAVEGVMYYIRLDKRQANFDKLKQSAVSLAAATILLNEAGASLEEIGTLAEKFVLGAAIGYTIAPLVSATITGAMVGFNAAWATVFGTGVLAPGL